jgi:cysteinyl-tRNA synthetase
MAIAHLGETIDIHAGGSDLIFPHHENEIAQSETATGKPFAKYWLHNGLTRIKTKAASGEWQDEKMSKSLGNIRTITELLEKRTGETIRAFVLGTQYRRPLEFSDEQLDNAAKSLETFYRLFERLKREAGADVYAGGQTIEKLLDKASAPEDGAFVEAVLGQRLRFYESMDDDFNTATAIAALHGLAGEINRYLDRHGSGGIKGALAAAAGNTLVATGRILGLFEAPPPPPTTDQAQASRIEALIAQRNAARKARDFARADEIRKQLLSEGVILEDTPKGTVWRKS